MARAMEQHGASLNFGSFVDAATVRQSVKTMAQGGGQPAELDQMRALVPNAMLDGGFGLASALICPPGNYATTHELAAIGREAGVPVEIYHLKATWRRNWKPMSKAIASIDSARVAGQDPADMNPYTAGATGLTACFPPGPPPTGSYSRIWPTPRRTPGSKTRWPTRTRIGKTWDSLPGRRKSSTWRSTSRRTRDTAGSGYPRSPGSATKTARHGHGSGAQREALRGNHLLPDE